MNTLLFLHGWATDGSVWKKQREYFSKNYKIITPDLHSGSLADLDRQLYALASVEDALVVIGWSFGWLVTLKLLAHADLNIKGLVSVCGTPKLISNDYIKDGVKAADLIALRRSLKENFVGTLSNFFATHKVTYNAQDVSSRKDISLKQLDILEKEDLRANLDLIKVPALFIAGEKDILCPAYVAQYMHARVEGSELQIIKDAFHTPFIERCEEFNRTLADFLSKL